MLPYVPKLIQLFYPSIRWEVATHERKIYLTFDDGPTPIITEQVLEILAYYEAKATFFCIGEKIQQNPEIFEKILKANHAIGNHTFRHLNGWKTPTTDYINEVEQCQKIIREHYSSSEKPLFRPPYGRITRKQLALLKNDYELVLWNVLTMDYDKAVSPTDCLNNGINHTKSGSIVVFHDSPKASEKMLFALPRFLAYFAERGFSFEKL